MWLAGRRAQYFKCNTWNQRLSRQFFHFSVRFLKIKSLDFGSFGWSSMCSLSIRVRLLYIIWTCCRYCPCILYSLTLVFHFFFFLFLFKNLLFRQWPMPILRLVTKSHLSTPKKETETETQRISNYYQQ